MVKPVSFQRKSAIQLEIPLSDGECSNRRAYILSEFKDTENSASGGLGSRKHTMEISEGITEGNSSEALIILYMGAP